MGESRIILSLATILAFRMLGLFMIYPVFAVYAPLFKHADSTLIGLALGIYGLTQGMLQLPLSMLSDRIGRKPIIMSGLLIFAVGSIISALADNIYLLILGRAFQGAGAIGSTLMACAADVTSDKNRTKAMAVLGMTIGISFALALVVGPIINTWFHLSGIFWLTALFAVAGLVTTYFFIPVFQNPAPFTNKQSVFKIIKQLLRQQKLLQLNISVFVLHAIFTASFVVIPLLFSKLGLPSSLHWKFYLPTLLGSFLLTLPFLIVSEKKNLVKQTVLLGILTIAASEYLFFSFASTLTSTLFALFIFFVGFTLLEALLPSIVSKTAPSNHKGTAMGLYATFQFLGIFVGGAFAGIIRHHWDNGFLFGSCLLLCAFWFVYIFSIKWPFVFSNKNFDLT